MAQLIMGVNRIFQRAVTDITPAPEFLPSIGYFD
jgi:hypothetical protein